MSSHENGRNGFRKGTREVKETDFYAGKGDLVPVPKCRELFPETMKLEAETGEGLELSEVTVSAKTFTQLRALIIPMSAKPIGSQEGFGAVWNGRRPVNQNPQLLLAYGREMGLTGREVKRIIETNHSSSAGTYTKAIDFYAALKDRKPGCGYAGGDCPLRRSF